MKKKIISILLALVLVLSFSLVTAAPVGAQEGVLDRATAITTTANRLVDLQSTTDYGWDWIVTELSAHSENPSAYNMYGVVILGLLDAYGETGTASYLAAATGMADHMTQGTASNGDFYKQGGEQEPAGAYDYQFLMRYAEVSGDSTYSDYAIALWAWNKANTAIFASPSALNDALLDWAGASDLGAAAWQLAAFGTAIHAMGDDTFATGCAALIVADLDPETGQEYLVGDHMALAECLEFLNELDPAIYSSTIDDITAALVAAQKADGCWDNGYAGTFQDTAYAVRALAVYGGTDGLNAARKGAAWLIANQLANGGWLDDSGGSSEEYSEQDAEGLRALVATEAPVTIGINGYYSIQQAIDAASADDIINVAAGTYEPFTVDGKTDLTIQSDGAVTVQGAQEVAIAYESEGSFDRDCVVFVKGSTGIVLDGLDIQGLDLGIINAKNYGVIYEDSIGVINDCTVSPNTIEDMLSIAIGIWDGSTVTVDTCTIENFGRVGMLIYDGCTAEVLGSTIIGQVYPSEALVCYGIEVEGAFNDATPGTGSQVTIRGNEIYNCNNTFDNLGPTWQSGGVYINGWMEYYDGEDSTVIVENNDIHDNYSGIIVIKSSSSYAHYNNIYDNRAFGVESLPAHDSSTVVFDATNNWWDSAVESEVQTMVSGNVDYSPWWGASYLTGTAPNIELVAHPWTWYTNDSIQAAINAADTGDTINVAPGTYKERITIEKELVIQSTDGVENTIIDGNGVGNNVVNIWWKNVTFQGFTVTNPTLGACADAGGIYVQDPANSDAKLVSNVYVLNNIVEATKSASEGTSSYGPAGIVIGPSSNVTVAGNIIRNLHNCPDVETDHTTGINVWGNDEASRPFDIVISNNVISDTDDYGILLEYASDVQIENNTVTGCDAGIRTVDATNVSVNFNNIFGNQTYGVNNGGTDVLDAENNWWGTLIGSDIAEMVSDYVDYSLWLDAPYPDGEPTSLDVTTISLASGWNLISLPLIPADPKIETVLAGADVTVNKVAYYTGGPDGSWQFYTLGVTSNLEQMNDGWGYWVDMETTTATLTISGYEHCKPAPTVPPEYHLVGGWNLIGFKSLSPIQAGLYLDELEPVMRAMYGYDTTSDVYTVIQTGTDLVPGKGYWLAVSAEGTIYP